MSWLMGWGSYLVRGRQHVVTPRPARAERKRVNPRKAISAVSDVVQNRSRSLRTFNQIIVNTGDIALRGGMIADWAAGKRLAFIGSSGDFAKGRSRRRRDG